MYISLFLSFYYYPVILYWPYWFQTRSITLQCSFKGLGKDVSHIQVSRHGGLVISFNLRSNPQLVYCKNPVQTLKETLLDFVSKTYLRSIKKLRICSLNAPHPPCDFVKIYLNSQNQVWTLSQTILLRKYISPFSVSDIR